MDYSELIKKQKAVCKEFDSEYIETRLDTKIGLSKAFNPKNIIHGLRHMPTETTSGWYIWSGEYSADPNFFEPVHVSHFINDSDFKFMLGLEPGYRFLIDVKNNYHDIWYDESLVST